MQAGRRLGLDDSCVTVGLIELWKGSLDVLQDFSILGRKHQKRAASASQLILTSASLCSRSPSALQPPTGKNEQRWLSENISVLTGKVDIRSIFSFENSRAFWKRLCLLKSVEGPSSPRILSPTNSVGVDISDHHLVTRDMWAMRSCHSWQLTDQTASRVAERCPLHSLSW